MEIGFVSCQAFPSLFIKRDWWRPEPRAPFFRTHIGPTTTEAIDFRDGLGDGLPNVDAWHGFEYVSDVSTEKGGLALAR